MLPGLGDSIPPTAFLIPPRAPGFPAPGLPAPGLPPPGFPAPGFPPPSHLMVGSPLMVDQLMQLSLIHI